MVLKTQEIKEEQPTPVSKGLIYNPATALVRKVGETEIVMIKGKEILVPTSANGI